MKKFIIINSIIFLMFLLLGFDCPVSHAQEKVVKLNFQALQPATHWSVPLHKEWINEIDKGTGGTVKITHYSGGLLSPMAQTYGSLETGIIDIGETVLVYTPGRFPFMEIGDVPLGAKSTYAVAKLFNELYKKFKPKEFDSVKVLYFNASAPHRIHANKPIYRLEDLQGLKVRTSGGTAKILRLLGTTPVSMTVAEIYDAVSRGVVDADYSADNSLKDFRLADVIKYSIWCDAAVNSTVWIVAMNKGKWDSLTPKQQKVVEEATSRQMEKHMREWDIQGMKVVKWAKEEKGVQFIVIPPEEQRRWGDKIKTMTDDYVQKMKKLGLPGEEAVKFATAYLKTHQ